MELSLGWGRGGEGPSNRLRRVVASISSRVLCAPSSRIRPTWTHIGCHRTRLAYRGFSESLQQATNKRECIAPSMEIHSWRCHGGIQQMQWTQRDVKSRLETPTSWDWQSNVQSLGRRQGSFDPLNVTGMSGPYRPGIVSTPYRGTSWRVLGSRSVCELLWEGARTFSYIRSTGTSVGNTERRAGLVFFNVNWWYPTWLATLPS